MEQLLFTLMAGVEITHSELGVLDHGEIDGHRTYGDPVDAAREYVAQGAHWIHLADLDAAAGRGSNADVVDRVIKAVRGDAAVQLAGGIRDEESFAVALRHKPRVIVLDTAALADADWLAQVIQRHGDGIAVDVTAHGTSLFAPGSSVHGSPVDNALDQLEAAGCPAFVVTDVDAQGARKGSHRKVLEQVVRRFPRKVVACGGIAGMGDLHHLADMVPEGLVGAVVDSALYTGAFSFAEALAATEPRYDPWEWGPARP